MPRSSGRERMIDAAVDVLMRDGLQGLTVDAAAAEANVSKGGLLYHFPSKDKLAQAVIVRWLGDFRLDVERRVQQQGFWSRGYVDAARADLENSSRERSAALLLLLAAESTGRAEVAHWKDAIRSRIDAELGPLDSALLISVIDGLWYAQLLDLPMPERTVVQEVFDHLAAFAGAVPQFSADEERKSS